MVHGLGGSSYNWDLLAARLGGTVTAIDLPGFGHSIPQAGDTFERHVEVVIEVLDGIEGPVTLVGNSMGGIVAEVVASRRRIEALVLIAPATPLPPGVFPSDPLTVARLLVQGMPILGPSYTRHLAEQGTPADQVRRTLAIVAADPGTVALEYVAASERLAALRRHAPWAYPSFTASARAVGRRLLRRRWFEDMIDHIESPTLLVWGDQDRVVTPAALHGLSARRPDWTKVELEGIGHVPMLEAPATTADIILEWRATLRHPARTAG